MYMIPIMMDSWVPWTWRIALYLTSDITCIMKRNVLLLYSEECRRVFFYMGKNARGVFETALSSLFWLLHFGLLTMVKPLWQGKAFILRKVSLLKSPFVPKMMPSLIQMPVVPALLWKSFDLSTHARLIAKWMNKFILMHNRIWCHSNAQAF